MAGLSKNDIRLALTFDDVLLIPQYSDLVPTEISTKSFFAKDLYLNSPLISSAMDTVTGHKVARVMAQLGGFGVIHKNMPIEMQAHEVEKVKKYESGMISEPITLGPDKRVQDALDLMKKYGISGVPITVKGKLVGILTNRDLRFETNTTQLIGDVMTKDDLVTAQVGTTLTQAREILQKHRIEKLPVVDKDGMLKGLITIKDIEKAKQYPQATKDGRGRLVAGAGIGVGPEAFERADALVAHGVDIICIDTAHGYSKNVIETTKYLRKRFPDIILISGNVATADGAKALFEAGADVVKVGMGSGSICTTRIVAGIGVPQISAVMDCAEVAKKMGKTVIADGGIRYSGDVTKAIALGANSIMVGNLLAGCDESPGETILYQGRTYKVYRGMGSIGAMKEGSKDRYGQAEVYENEKLVPEGIEGKVPYKGSASGIIYQLLGGLKSGMGYLGANSVQELQDRAQFVRISPFGLKESHVHDVTITKEAPNYRLE